MSNKQTSFGESDGPKRIEQSTHFQKLTCTYAWMSLVPSQPVIPFPSAPVGKEANELFCPVALQTLFFGDFEPHTALVDLIIEW